MEKKLDGNYTRMLWAILNKSWRLHLTKHQLYCHLPPITKTIKVRQTRHVGHCWRSKDDHISYILLWTPSHGQGKAGQPAKNYIQQLCADTGYSLEDPPPREQWMIETGMREGQGDLCKQCNMMIMMTVSISKQVQFQKIQFSISTQFTCQNSSISSNSV